MRITLPILFLLTSLNLCAQPATNDILQKAERYYSSLQTFSVTVTERFKSASSEKTHESTYPCFIDRPNKTALFSWYLVRGGNEYSINFRDSSFLDQKAKKQGPYATKFSRYPFVNFSFLKKEITAAKPRLVEQDSVYQLVATNVTYEFRKEDGSMCRIYRTGKDDLTEGDYSIESVFNPVKENDPAIVGKIALAEDIIRSNKKIEVSKPKKPTHLDTSLLNDPRIFWFNGKPGSLAGKKIVLDFFFQGCYPCVMSYPEINELYESKDSSTVVIGIDSTPADSLTAETYLNKYKLRHPVATGLMAKKISDQLAISGWPTFMVINEKGKIIIREEGFTSGRIQRIARGL